MRGEKNNSIAGKTLKRDAKKPVKLKKGVKLSSEDWYKRAAAALSIRSSNVPSPSIAPD